MTTTLISDGSRNVEKGMGRCQCISPVVLSYIANIYQLYAFYMGLTRTEKIEARWAALTMVWLRSVYSVADLEGGGE